ncbi:hypothetical protein GF1_12570 [Desulfolithobacter dissulfuricans]|uniref:Uncharacterized protein n=1 Tax=Desulfolithobacter dissulfuricans TaxID=2795293 RepID=A0A915TZU6_9BACT|nr:hypothetical protein [Desulfolithobacter dissulfuricans]BCO08881.1 hypothetical protein GF1_12570 [Desulfolithobacter dissulfuricans]
MSQIETIPESLGDFAAVLVREISRSLALMRHDAPLIRVDRVRIRFGQPEGEDSVLTDRYPFLADGWVVEMEMDPLVQARLQGEPLPEEPAVRTLLDIFKDHSITDIKGVNRDWSAFFKHHGLETIGQLAAISTNQLSALARQRRSVKLWELHGKARLLQSDMVYFPSTALDRDRLYTLLKMDPEELLQRAGATKVSRAEIERLGEIMELLAIVVDSRVLQSMRLRDLLW